MPRLDVNNMNFAKDGTLIRIEEINEFSGFEKEDSKPIIRKLIKEIRSLKEVSKLFIEALDTMHKGRDVLSLRD